MSAPVSLPASGLRLSLAQVLALEQAGGIFAAAEAIAAVPLPPPAQMLGQLLIDILRPLTAMGAVMGEGSARRIDVENLRRFFIGVMGWKPQDFYAATLDDLQAGFDGWRLRAGRDGQSRIDANFMAQMQARFPDNAAQEDNP